MVFLFKYDLGQKYYAPQIQPNRGFELMTLNSWPRDHDRAFHVIETPALTTRPSVTSNEIHCITYATILISTIKAHDCYDSIKKNPDPGMQNELGLLSVYRPASKINWANVQLHSKNRASDILPRSVHVETMVCSLSLLGCLSPKCYLISLHMEELLLDCSAVQFGQHLVIYILVDITVSILIIHTPKK